MEDSNFHMFLSSNTNPVEHPENKPSDFTTLYGESVKLDGNWEVGVKQMTYPNNILTTVGTETLTTMSNGATILEGSKAKIREDKEYYDFDEYIIEKPSYDKKKGYSPEEIVKNFNAIPIAKSGVAYLEYRKKYDKMILQVDMNEVAIGLSFDLSFNLFWLKDLVYTRGTYWGAFVFNRTFKSNAPWKVTVFPLYRLTKEVLTICEANEDMKIDDMIAKMKATTKDYNVKWTIKRSGGKTLLKLETKPDPSKDVNCSLITFNDATMDMLKQPHGYFEPSYKEFSGYRRLDGSYKDSSYYGKEPMTLTIYSRKISNRSLCQPFSIYPGEWNIFTFPRKQYTTPEELLAVLQSFKPPASGRVDFSYDAAVKRFKVNVPLLSCLHMDPVICDILGFKHKQYFTGADFTAEYTPALDRAVDNLFVYSDITESIFVGNVKAPLLCIIPREKKPSSAAVINSWSVDNPTYMPIRRKSFNQQRIIIMDDAGQRVPFIHGKTVLLLHFRKRI